MIENLHELLTNTEARNSESLQAKLVAENSAGAAWYN